MSHLRETLPEWAKEMIALYESDSANQFILYGNIYDRFLFEAGSEAVHGSLVDFLKRVLMPQFDVIFNYDLGNGLRVERGGERLKRMAPNSGCSGVAESAQAGSGVIDAISALLRKSWAHESREGFSWSGGGVSTFGFAGGSWSPEL